MDSKRSHYRVRARHDSIEITLRTAEGTVAGKVNDLTVSGAGASFPADGIPEAMPGDRVQLEFKTLLLLQPLTTEAVVRQVRAEGDVLHFGFEFIDPRAVLRDVPYVLRPYFNRRRHPRVELDEPVPAELDAPGLSAQGWLQQIGTGGAMIGLPMELASRLARDDRLEVRFELPGVDARFWFLGIVRGLWNTGSELGCSLRFDRRATVDAREQLEHLRCFVNARLSEVGEPGSGVASNDDTEHGGAEPAA